MPVIVQEKKRYTLFECIQWGNRFFTLTNYDDPHPEQLADGTVAYRVLGYADTVCEAQIALYGRAFIQV